MSISYASDIDSDLDLDLNLNLDLAQAEMVILGTQYAGEMKKGILTLMMYQVRRRRRVGSARG